jgi:hypothetical protein
VINQATVVHMRIVIVKIGKGIKGTMVTGTETETETDMVTLWI